ncbi:MAG: putative bifunctional diguanylate cyclase/phosphodiesterase, partial [Acidimicrobiales bacterium]
ARAVAERILGQFRQPFRVDGSELHVTVSIGIGVAGPDDGVQELLVAADTALYTAKGAGKDRYRVFEPRQRAAARERSTLRNDLTSALERGEMEVFYQPIVKVATGAVAGLEALLRWRHPRRGLLLPAEFLSLAEESGLIVPVGRWVLREACGQTARWRSAHVPLSHLRVSVNLSGRQLQDPELAEVVATTLGDTGLPADALTLEVSERIVADLDAMLDTVCRLRSLGATVAIDDFGAFGSSLRFLRRFPPGELKLDRTLVAGLDGSAEAGAMVGAVIDLGHALHLQAVAEGVEQPGQLEQLAGLGCDLAQGLHWVGPRPAADVERWLTSATNP